MTDSARLAQHVRSRRRVHEHHRRARLLLDVLGVTAHFSRMHIRNQNLADGSPGPLTAAGKTITMIG